MRTYIKGLPSFDKVNNCFLSCKSLFFKRNKLQDLCLSLFFQPYFSEFYCRIKLDANTLLKDKKNLLKKDLLNYLASEIHYKGIMDFEVGGPEIKQWYHEKDIYKKSKELIYILI